MKIILASGSPRRKQLLKNIVKDFEVIVSNADELKNEKILPEDLVLKNAKIKAEEVISATSGERVIISADTIVVRNKKIYEKPKDEKDAFEMIKELDSDNRTHEIFTGTYIKIIRNDEEKDYEFVEKTKVTFLEISDEEIKDWIKLGKAMDKAGGYAIQEEFCKFVEKIDGNYENAVGLPVSKIYSILKKENII